MSFEARLTELGITLPQAPKPVATYIPAVRVGDLLFLSGTGPFKDGAIVYAGKLGKDLTVEQGYEAARLTLLNALADRKSTRLNSSHLVISYAVFCLKKKKKKNRHTLT